MGYDDNTPLSGVTGGGLPAEIWRETMMRVHEGLPAKPLPGANPVNNTRLDANGGQRPSAPELARADPPRFPGNSREAGSNRRQQSREDDPLERVILDVLNGLFGN